VPIVLLEVGGGPYWRRWDAFVRDTMCAQHLIDPDDAALYRLVDGIEAAVAQVLAFYRVYHSSRVVGDNIVLRLRQPLADARITDLQSRFEDILKGPADQASGPLPQENGEFPDLPRLILPFNRSSYGRLRRLIDFVNEDR
jgi:hypothetical protein